MYHGPWLQMTKDQLEFLVHSNNKRPRPKPYDPAVLHDIYKIRVAVDEATDFAVRAASGVVSSPGHGSMGAGKGMMHGAEALGLTFGSNGAPTKLSRERQYRMREMATQKLSQAYHLDEIATSVATMQSASTLDDLAMHVLRKNPTNFEGTYVHFFHEKIPSRKIAEFTPLDGLDGLINERPNDASPYRTRALIRIFKDDFEGAVKDLTQGLAVARLFPDQHRPDSERGSDVAHPSSLESQLLFHRANCHLQIASKHILSALEAYKISTGDLPETTNGHSCLNKEQAKLRHIELRKSVKTNAKKALRDFMAFLSYFEYAPKKGPERTSYTSQEVDPEIIYKASDLFAASPPSTLPPYPPLESEELVLKTSNPEDPDEPLPYDMDQRISFHPLLPEALCSMLITHAIVQTPTTELRRHVYNAARLIRILGGLPVFGLGRSSSAATWSEILRATNNWIDMSHSWLSLCGREIALYGHPTSASSNMSVEQKEQHQIQNAILTSLTDENAVDDETFHQAVTQRLQRSKEIENGGGQLTKTTTVVSTQPKKRWNPELPDKYFSSHMVRPIVKWILMAPLTVEGEKSKSGARKRKKKTGPALLLEHSMSGLSVNTTEEVVD